jgi:hypothetical protein
MSYVPPFYVSGGVKDNVVQVVVGRGYVNWREPVVRGEPISGMKADGTTGVPPAVRGPLAWDKYRRCYVCLRVRVGDNGGMPLVVTDDDLTVVVAGGIRRAHNYGREYWLHPLATIAEGAGGYVFCQNVYFNIAHWVGLTEGTVGEEGSAVRYHHYFAEI